MTTFEGLRLAPRYSFANAPPIDVLVLPSARGSMDKDLENRAMIDWVRKVAGQARYLVDKLYGQNVAQGIGKGLLIPWPPDPATMPPRSVETPAPATDR